jgi:N-acetylglucosamine-6-phosphate deacetylase
MTKQASAVEHQGKITFSGRLFPSGSPTRVEVMDGRIHVVEQQQSFEEANGVQRWVAPGFYDLQVNGFAGVDLADPRVGRAEIRHMAEAVLKTGCTRFLATIITADLDVMCARLGAVADAIESDPFVGTVCVGIHVEGPFIHPEDGPRGAHPRQHVRRPNVPDFQRLHAACRGKMKILTLAPEQPGAVEVIRAATAAGVVVAIGHHRADREAIAAAVAAGARMTTHLGNGADALLPRTDNCIWSQLAEDRLWASMVADGHHLPPAALKTMIRGKTPERTMLITDAMAAAAMPPGPFMLSGLEVVKTPAGRVCLPGTPYLAGSAAEMPMLISHAVADAGLSLPDAVRLTTLQPACMVPTAIDPWSCSAGKPANLVEFDWQPETAGITIRQAAIGRFAVTCGG